MIHGRWIKAAQIDLNETLRSPQLNSVQPPKGMKKRKKLRMTRSQSVTKRGLQGLDPLKTSCFYWVFNEEK